MFDPERPPYDEFAERLILWHTLYQPALVRKLDLESLLVADSKHRAIWAAMQWVAHNKPELVPADGVYDACRFFWAWQARLCRVMCDSDRRDRSHEFWTPGRCAAHHLWLLLEQARQDEWEGVTVNDSGHMVCALPTHSAHERSTHKPSYWLARLNAVVDARAQAEYAHYLTREAWRWYRTFDDPKPEPPSDVVSVEELAS